MSLQKLAYLAVIFVLLPLMVLTGLTMSPGVDAAWPWLLDVFGGRQSARTIHFITASLLVAFTLVHLVMVLVSGVWNNLRSMITGRYAIQSERPAMTRLNPASLTPSTAAASWPALPRAPAASLLGGCDLFAGNETATNAARRSAEWLTHARPSGSSRARTAGAGVHRGGPVAGLPLERHLEAGRRRLREARLRPSSPTGGSR